MQNNRQTNNKSSKSTLLSEDPNGNGKKENQPSKDRRKISLQQFCTSTDRVFGLFNVEEYKILRGFIPGRGKRVRLHYTKFQPLVKVASICIVHGYGEQSDDYLQVRLRNMQIADHFAKNGFVVHMIDMRGFGYSGGHRMQDCVQELFYDIESLLKCCQQNLPAFIMAAGFGSMLVLNLLIDNPRLPINGVVVLTPTLTFPQKDSSVSGQVIKYLCRELMGEFLVNSHVNPTAITKRTDVLKKSIDQGLSYQYIKLSVLQNVEQASSKLCRDAHLFNYPILLYYGASNSLQPISTIEKLFSDFSSKDKTFKIFAEGFHSLHLDVECKQIKEESLNWMSKRMIAGRMSKMPQFNQVKIRKYRLGLKTLTVLIGIVLALVKFLRWLARRK